MENFSTESIPSEQFFDFFLQKAIQMRASDVHFEQNKNAFKVRFRIDGKLQTIVETEKSLGAAVISKVKLRTNLKLDETTVPQDGRLCLKFNNESYDVRVSTLPTMFGEDIVLRIFNQEEVDFCLDNIGLDSTVRCFIDGLIERPSGLILVAGATGSGKTTTLYSILKAINSVANKVITIEDPIEYRLDGISQVAVNESIGLTFANVLRSILRQAPNVIMLGEIRDAESAELVIQAALTGHLVLSTIHADTSAGALSRLRDLGISNFLINSCLRGVISQRLALRPCKHCVTERAPTNDEMQLIGRDNVIDKVAVCNGCEKCLWRGYLGRTGIFELMQAVGDENRQFEYVRTFEQDVVEKLRAQSVLFSDVSPFFVDKKIAFE